MIDTCTINQLPAEMLSEILIQWSLIDGDGPWMASSVCHHWRRVVLATHEAWAIPRLEFLPPPELPDERWCIEEEDMEAAASPRGKPRPFDLWIDRSGSTKGISLLLTAFISCPQLAVRIPRELRALQRYLPRICELVITVESDAIAEQVLSMFKKLAPNMKLRHLDISLIGSPRIPFTFRATPPEQSTLRRLWDIAPSFQALTCRGCLPGFPLHGVPGSSFPFIQDIVIDKAELSPLRLATILSECTELRSVRLSRLFNTYPIHVFQPAVQRYALSQVHTFRIERCSTEYTQHMLGILTVPALQDLTVGNLGLDEVKRELMEGQKMYDLMADFGQAFADFVQRSPQLTALHIMNSPLPDRHLLSVLRHTQILRTLHLTRLFVGTPAMRGLMAHRQSTKTQVESMVTEQAVPCPLLSRLHLSRCDLIDGKVVITLLRSRNTSSGTTEPLVSFSVDDCPKIAAGHVQELRQLHNLHVRSW